MSIIQNKLVCEICGSEKTIPKCCDKSMIAKNGYLLCCCSEECGHHKFPQCCGEEMKFIKN